MVLPAASGLGFCDAIFADVMRIYRKQNFPPAKIRRFLEPGPVVLISSAWKNERNLMTLGWHMMLGFEPALVGCFIWDRNHSFELIRRSKQCVINLPTADLIDTVIAIGNCHGGPDAPDKFEQFNLTPLPATKVNAPLVAECYANFECKLVDASLIRKYGLFVFEVVKAHAARSPRYPTTVHCRGDGVFMIAGRNVSYRRRFKRVNL
jgi:flavin reductase (DIM6/NTAB) family NADH-FMN oxidoreductase RutF